MKNSSSHLLGKGERGSGLQWRLPASGFGAVLPNPKRASSTGTFFKTSYGVEESFQIMKTRTKSIDINISSIL